MIYETLPHTLLLSPLNLTLPIENPVVKFLILSGTAGLLYIMFLAGLEIDLTEFKKNSHKSALFGLYTFSIPMTLGILLGYYILGFSMLTSVLLASMFASHTLIAYPIVNKLGVGRNRAVTVTIGGTMITDTLALLVLAVIVGMTQGNVDGAFLSGLALNRLIPHSSPLMNRVEFIGNAIFIPFFLIGVGMLIDYRVFFAGWNTILVAISMTVVATLAKYLAAWAATRTFKYTKAEMLVMFGLSNAQAAATLAAVMVGYNVILGHTPYPCTKPKETKTPPEPRPTTAL